MPRYFLDTSALAKVYRKEPGSDLMDRIVTEPGSHRFISRFTILEMESVLALKFRTAEIDEHSLITVRRRLEADLGSRRLLEPLSVTNTSVELVSFSSIMAG